MDVAVRRARTLFGSRQNICSVVISTHFEVHENTLPELVEAENIERSEAVSTAVRWVNETITQELRGMAPSSQAEVDQVLRCLYIVFHLPYLLSRVSSCGEREDRRDTRDLLWTPWYPIRLDGCEYVIVKGRKDTFTEKPVLPPEPGEPVLCGSMAIGAVSLAVAKTSAMLDSNPLYLNIALLKHHQEHPAKLTVPLLMVSLVSCGKSSPGKLNLMKEQPITGKMSHLGCLTINYDTTEQPLLLIQGICANLGLEMGTNLHLAINCAAHELMDYDSEQWDSIYNALGSRCYIIAGTASKSIPKLLEDGNVSVLRQSGLIIKHTNQTTVSDLVEITNLMDSKKHVAVFGSTEGESSDDSLVDLAVGLGVRFIKLGGLSRGERVTKYNRLFAIEEELVQNGTLGFNEEHTFFYLSEEAEKAAVAGELPGPPGRIFPTEVVEESVKT
ncbi:enolase family member 4 isoform 2 [Camelus ferus]|nr:enolase family member 4 isoform 2 [Camelus ferus]